MPGQRFAFVLRLWIEADTRDTGAGRALRGSLQPADSEQVRYFNSFEGILEILHEITGWRDPPGGEASMGDLCKRSG